MVVLDTCSQRLLTTTSSLYPFCHQMPVVRLESLAGKARPRANSCAPLPGSPRESAGDSLLRRTRCVGTNSCRTLITGTDRAGTDGPVQIVDRRKASRLRN